MKQTGETQGRLPLLTAAVHVHNGRGPVDGPPTHGVFTEEVLATKGLRPKGEGTRRAEHAGKIGVHVSRVGLRDVVPTLPSAAASYVRLSPAKFLTLPRPAGKSDP